MALDFYLTIENINDTISPDHIRELLTSVFLPETCQDSDILISDGVAISIFREDDEESVFKNPYPDICVSFRVDKFEKYERGINMMLKAVFRLVSHFKSDMILSSDDEEIIFQRTSGKSAFSNDFEFWTDARLPLFDFPYQYRPDEMNVFEAVS